MGVGWSDTIVFVAAVLGEWGFSGVDVAEAGVEVGFAEFARKRGASGGHGAGFEVLLILEMDDQLVRLVKVVAIES